MRYSPPRCSPERCSPEHRGSHSQAAVRVGLAYSSSVRREGKEISPWPRRPCRASMCSALRSSGVLSRPHRAEGTDQIRAEIHCKGGSAGGSASFDVEQPPERPIRPPEGPAPRASSEKSDVEIHDQGSLPMRLVRCGCGHLVRPGQGSLAGALGDQIKVALRTSCCTVDRPVHGNAASGYFLTDTEHGTRHVPCC